MPNKTAVANSYQLANKGVGLYAAVVTNGSRFLYFSKRANKTVATNSAPVYVTRLNDGNVFTQYNICRNRHRKLFVVLHAVGGILHRDAR